MARWLRLIVDALVIASLIAVARADGWRSSFAPAGATAGKLPAPVEPDAHGARPRFSADPTVLEPITSTPTGDNGYHVTAPQAATLQPDIMHDSKRLESKPEPTLPQPTEPAKVDVPDFARAKVPVQPPAPIADPPRAETDRAPSPPPAVPAPKPPAPVPVVTEPSTATPAHPSGPTWFWRELGSEPGYEAYGYQDGKYFRWRLDTKRPLPAHPTRAA